MKLVSIYIVNHNYAKYLEQSINSVLNQDFKNYHLMIIDNGSTDNSQEILQKFQNQEEIDVIFRKNKGLTVANNIALKMSQGRYIMRLDADDYLEPNALRLMFQKLEDNPELALVFPDYWNVDETGKIINRVRRHDFNEEVTLLDLPAHGACTMIRREILEDLGGYDENFSRQDGFDLWLKTVHKFKVSNINKPLFYYRRHNNNLTNNEKLLLETRAKIIHKHVKDRKIEDVKVLAVIPTRGVQIDSRSLPLETLGDKKLIDWTINSALKSSEVDKIVVTSPDNDVLSHVKKIYKNQVLLHYRDAELASINLDIYSTISTILAEINDDFVPDFIIVLNIEAPFRSSMYIDKSVHVMQIFNVDMVIGVKCDDDMFFVHDGGGLKPFHKDEHTRLERDSLYKKVGGITLINREYFEKRNNVIEGLSGLIGHINLDQKAAFLIKSKLDLKIAKALAEIK
jgi:glycosyltransferase involved in cell wall biosynthesis